MSDTVHWTNTVDQGVYRVLQDVCCFFTLDSQCTCIDTIWYDDSMQDHVKSNDFKVHWEDSLYKICEVVVSTTFLFLPPTWDKLFNLTYIFRWGWSRHLANEFSFWKIWTIFGWVNADLKNILKNQMMSKLSLNLQLHHPESLSWKVGPQWHHRNPMASGGNGVGHQKVSPYEWVVGIRLCDSPDSETTKTPQFCGGTYILKL